VTIIESRPTGDTGSAKTRTAGGLQADWAGQGRCVSNDPDALFVRGAAQQNAKNKTAKEKFLDQRNRKCRNQNSRHF